MLKRVGCFVQKELVSGMRNNVMLYILLFTVLLSLAMRLFLPGMEGMKLTFAAEENIGAEVIQGLARYGTVEVFADAAQVRQRVDQADDVPGMIRNGEEYVIILEGNEAGEAEEIASAILHLARRGGPRSEYSYIPMGREGSAVRQMLTALILLMAALIGGFVVGLNIVAEKESRSMKALAVSPLKTGEMVLGHLILCILAGVMVTLSSVFLLMGKAAPYGSLLLVSAVSSLLGVLVGYIIGIFADNLISAIAVIKVLMLFFWVFPWVLWRYRKPCIGSFIPSPIIGRSGPI